MHGAFALSVRKSLILHCTPARKKYDKSMARVPQLSPLTQNATANRRHNVLRDMKVLPLPLHVACREPEVLVCVWKQSVPIGRNLRWVCLATGDRIPSDRSTRIPNSQQSAGH